MGANYLILASFNFTYIIYGLFQDPLQAARPIRWLTDPPRQRCTLPIGPTALTTY